MKQTPYMQYTVGKRLQQNTIMCHFKPAQMCWGQVIHNLLTGMVDPLVDPQMHPGGIIDDQYPTIGEQTGNSQ